MVEYEKKEGNYMSKNSKQAKCFIITPIGDEKDSIRRHIEGIIDAAITPVLGDKYEIVVAHRIKELGTITKQVIKEINDAELVIANITNRNPNVMYELALRHAIGKPVITIAEKGTPLPADIISERTIFYYNDAKGVLELRDDLKNIEAEIDFNKLSGPIYDVLGEIFKADMVLQSIKQTDQPETQPLEYILERLNRIENAINDSQNQNTIVNNTVKSSFRLISYIIDLNEPISPSHEKHFSRGLKDFLQALSNVHINNIELTHNRTRIEISMTFQDFDFELYSKHIVDYLRSLLGNLGYTIINLQ